MKVLQYIQVLLLLALLGMILMIQLENPLEVRIPFLFGGRTSISLGWFLLMTLAMGAFYTFFLMLPPYLRSLWSARTERLRNLELSKSTTTSSPPEFAPAESPNQP